MGLSASTCSTTRREGREVKVNTHIPSFVNNRPLTLKGRKAVDGAPRPNESEVKVVREIEKAASRSSATEAALKPIRSSSSWWPNINLWSKSESPATKDSAETSPRFEATKTNKDGKGENT
jgi:hypothetical protein